MSYNASRADLEADLLPQPGHADRIIATGVEPIHIVNFHRVTVFRVVPAVPVVAMCNLLVVQSKGFFPVGHARLDG